MIYNSELRKLKAKKKMFDNLNICIWIGQWFISRVTLKAKVVLLRRQLYIFVTSYCWAAENRELSLKWL